MRVDRFNRDAPAVRHRIPRVHREVQDDLFDLRAIGFHGTQIASERGLHEDVLADKAVQHLLDGAHDGIQVEDDRLDDLAAAERQQLPRQLRRGLARLLNFKYVVAVRVRNFGVVEQQLAITQDRREHVVEIVGNASGKPSHRIHFLRALVVLLDLFALHLGAQALLLPLFEGRGHRIEVFPELVQLGNRRAGSDARAEIAGSQPAARARQLRYRSEQETVGRVLDHEHDGARREPEREEVPVHRPGGCRPGLRLRQQHPDGDTAFERLCAPERRHLGITVLEVLDNARFAQSEARCDGVVLERLPDPLLTIRVHRENRVLAIGDDDGRVVGPVPGAESFAQSGRIDRREHHPLHLARIVHNRKCERKRGSSGLPPDVVFADDECFLRERALKVAAIGERHVWSGKSAADHRACRVDDAEIRVHRSELRHHPAKVRRAVGDVAVTNIAALRQGNQELARAFDQSRLIQGLEIGEPLGVLRDRDLGLLAAFEARIEKECNRRQGHKRGWCEEPQAQTGRPERVRVHGAPAPHCDAKGGAHFIERSGLSPIFPVTDAANVKPREALRRKV